jgi:phosphoserine phosphatase RsbU/P
MIDQQLLQHELPGLMLATIFMAAGIVSVTLWRMRSREPLLIWLGIFAFLYGARLAIGNQLIRAATGLSISKVILLIWIITCVILIPTVLFFRELFGPPWRKASNAWLWIQVVFAPIGIAVGFSRYRGNFWSLHPVITGAGSLFVIYVLLSRRRPESSTGLRWALVIFLVFVIATNLGLRPGGLDVEPIGFAVLIGGLAYAAAQRSTQRENKLREVEYELETARRIQTSILPRQLPAVAGLELAARYQPMTAVAGDFYDFLYDFLPVNDHALTILVADVSGHGVPAALIASMLKVAFQAQAEHAADPAKVLAGLNSVLSGQMEGRFVTASCAYIDMVSRTIAYAGAGHPPALLLRASGEVVELCENGLMLGPFRQAQFTSVRVAFECGDKLLLYTDGIIEAGDFDLEALKDFARKSPAEEKPAAFADRVMRTIARKVQDDDLTVVVAQAT